MLTDMHMVVYIWWCWHICKGEGVGVDHPVGDHLELSWFAKMVFVVLLTMGWILEWISGLIHYVLDQVFGWIV